MSVSKKAKKKAANRKKSGPGNKAGRSARSHAIPETAVLRKPASGESGLRNQANGAASGLASGALVGVFSQSPRPARVSGASATLTLAWRAMLKIKHVPFQMFDVTIMPVMFTLLFTFIFGGALAGTS